MKNVLIYLVICASLALALVACEPPCKNVDCGANGICNEENGTCACIDGYELDANGKCDVKVNAKFIGQWMSPEICTPSTNANPYTITITEVSGDLRKVRISNFGRTNCDTDPLVVTAIIDGTKLISFTETCVSVNVTGGSATLSADGKFLNVSYTLIDGAGIEYSCTAAMEKQ